MIYDNYEYLTNNFQLFEFLHFGSQKGLTPEIYSNLKLLAKALQSIRVICGNSQIIIYSGFRTPQHNKEVGGAGHSYHMAGMAADIMVKGQNPRETQRRLRNFYGGLGFYSTWTHVDIGPKRTPWEGS